MKMSSIIASIWMCRTSIAFVGPSNVRKSALRLFSVSNTVDVNMGVSRLETLQTLLSRRGAPGSAECTEQDDLEPVIVASSDDDTPELISTLTGLNAYVNLHPHLYPLAQSKKNGNVICALRRAFANDGTDWYEKSSSAPWPIVEAKLGGPGMRLLALNSEHMMRRIVCECDFSGEAKELIELYNEGLGSKAIQEKGLDEPYEPGSVEKLG
jgi:hypothetical protein